MTRLESEIDGVRQREDRDRGLLDSGSVSPKQLEELQHELDTLQRRQTSLEDSLLEVMERREQLAAEQADEAAKLDALQQDLAKTAQLRDDALAEIDDVRGQRLGAPGGTGVRAGRRTGRSLRAAAARPGWRRAAAGRRCGRAASSWTAARSPASRPRPTTRWCAARSAGRSCCRVGP